MKLQSTLHYPRPSSSSLYGSLVPRGGPGHRLGVLLARCVIFFIALVDTFDRNATALVSFNFVVLVILNIAGSKYLNKRLALLEQSYIHS